ncbi:serine/threonine-protein kinase PINK1, mitochondrial-like [Amphiura filiformis]|uniref:serine/threonine-protein kinase PINK1, mitochondrial-like n=1 Tax=Amphiura filiformis TaxID=82378 RepID=UPI003B21999C
MKGKKRDENINLMPLDVCCQVIKNTFQKTDINNPLDLPSDLASYELSPQLLGKGCNASIYAARVNSNHHESSIESSLQDPDDFEVVPMEPMDEVCDTSSDSDIDEELEDDFVVLNPDVEEHGPHLELPATFELPAKSEESFNLAIKMMFNYDVLSNAIAISRAFEKEYLPLQQVPNELCDSTMLQWQNGNHVKKKKKYLVPHPNIVAMYHAFSAPVDVHDLAEAKELFPAALPRRIHTDGIGRNMTMFIVMKMYDMTLTEYIQSVGCPSQRVAMVIIAQLLEGVSHLVANGIAHRDLKGNNILVNVDPDGGSPHVVLADFGCCLADSNVSLVLPYPSTYTCIGGNTALMAPEIKLAEPGPGVYLDYSKSDAWSIGAIAYEVLGHRNPFYRQGNQAGLDSGMYEESELPSLADTHTALGRVIRMLLRKDPSKRPTPQVAADMLHLSLWQPEWWRNACWESGHILPTQRHITNWLLRVSMATVDSDYSREEHGSCVFWQNATEQQLCESWLGRVKDSELMQAVAGLCGIWQ